MVQEEKGRMRFEYGDQWITVVIESHVMPGNGQSLKNGMDSLAQVLQATDRKLGSDYFILSGPQCENGSRIDGYSYYTKIMVNHKLWFVYTMIYPDDYKDVLTRLFKEIDDWQSIGITASYPSTSCSRWDRICPLYVQGRQTRLQQLC